MWRNTPINQVMQIEKLRQILPPIFIRLYGSYQDKSKSVKSKLSKVLFIVSVTKKVSGRDCYLNTYTRQANDFKIIIFLVNKILQIS